MIIAAMIGYYVFAAGVLVLVGYTAARQNVRRFKALADEAIANMERSHTPPLVDDAPNTTGEVANLHDDYTSAVAGLRASIRAMAAAGIVVSPNTVTADVFAGELAK